MTTTLFEEKIKQNSKDIAEAYMEHGSDRFLWIKAKDVLAVFAEYQQEQNKKLNGLDTRSLDGWNKEKARGKIGGHAVLVLLQDVKELLGKSQA